MWKVAGHSLVGTSHLKGGIPGQDCCGFRQIQTAEGRPRTVIAISDGAGSARQAEIGSRLTVELALEQVAAFSGELSEIDLALALRWLGKVQAQLAEHARANGGRLGDFSATLLLAVLEEERGFFLQIGDGAWIVQTPGGIEAATWPEDGEYVNETTFLTSARFAEHVSLALLEAPRCVAGFTDGIQRLFLDFKQNGPHQPLVQKIFSALVDAPAEAGVSSLIEAFLGSPLVNEQVDDDKTLVLAWRDFSAETATNGE